MNAAFNLDWKNVTKNQLQTIAKQITGHEHNLCAEYEAGKPEQAIEGMLNELIRQYNDPDAEDFSYLNMDSNEAWSAGLVKYIQEAAEEGDDLCLDGDFIKEDWFPVMNADIFLSHSHRDIKIALRIKYLLEKVFGLNVFVDSAVWGYADNLLRDIDNLYAAKGTRSYWYQRRNQTTAVVHLMLETALTEMMTRSEAVFFLNTQNSTMPDFLNQTQYEVTVASPWIYHELKMAQLFCELHQVKNDVKVQGLNESYVGLMVTQTTDISKFRHLTFGQFVEWVRKMRNVKRPIHEDSHMDAHYEKEYKETCMDKLYNLIGTGR